MSARKPTLHTGPASQYAATNEIIREFSNDKHGGLISLKTMDDGTLRVELYQLDAEVTVVLPSNRT